MLPFVGMFAPWRRVQPVATSVLCLRRCINQRFGPPRRRDEVINVRREPGKAGIPFMHNSTSNPLFGFNRRTYWTFAVLSGLGLSFVAYRKYKKRKRKRADEKVVEELAEKIEGAEDEDVLPRPLVVAGPSGVGKTTLLQRLIEEFPDAFAFCISHTTRGIRKGETDGKLFLTVAA